MKIMLLTAGQGTRLRPHTERIPKPAIPFLNMPLFLYSVNLLAELSPRQLVFNTFHLAEELKKTVLSSHLQQKITFSDETILLGSGGGIGFARDHFQEDPDFILVNGDEVIIPKENQQLLKAMEQHRKSRAIATILVTDHAGVGTKFGGVWLDSDNNVLGFGKTPITGAIRAKHFIGVIIFSKEIFKYIPQGESNILYDNIMSAIRQGSICKTFDFKCEWFETGSEKDFLHATENCLKIISRNNEGADYLQKMLEIYAPDSKLIIQNDGIFLVDNSSEVIMSQLSGNVIVGHHSQLSPACQIFNSVIGHQITVTRQKNGVTVQDKLILF
ncbi:MAG: NTP transferase domain-containing protein [Bdellovibrionaceae bacterium]|nr:NTP transferase domain-containing protein [Pseudobdellovibrionaceae bacterium]NUM58110.1 NTP transferase domain-containing protein [Pseudobdellovibrionaceae bacterium]